MADLKMLENTPPELAGDPRYAADKAIRDAAWDAWRKTSDGRRAARAMPVVSAIDQVVNEGYFEKARSGDLRGASYFARLVAFRSNPEASTAAVGALRKGGGSNVEGYADDAVCGNANPADLFNVYDLVGGSGAPGASPTVNGPLPRRDADTWEAPRALSADQMNYLKAGSGTPAPGPIPAPGLPAWETKHTELLIRLGQPSGALDPAWVRRVAEQLAFSFPGEGWGCKSADPSRPQSGDVIARQSSGRLVGYQIVPPTLQPQAIDLAGQHFIPVSPTNHVGATPPVDPPPPDPGTPPPTPSPDLSQVLAAIGVLQVLVEAVQRSADESKVFQQETAAALKELASNPPSQPTIQWPIYRSDRLPVIGTITLRPQP
jgi:hypothetical protein